MKCVFTFLLLCLISSIASAQTSQFFNYKHGLSNSLVNQIYQDRYGFIWVATEDGLNRFDGQIFRQHLKQDDKPKSLKSDFIKVCGEDNEGNLLVGYNYGLMKFSYSTETFDDYKFYSLGQRVYPNITCLALAKNGTLWISSSANGIYYIEPNSKNPIYPEKINNQIPGIFHEYIFEDSDSIIWVASEKGGLSSYNPVTGKVKNYTYQSKDGTPMLEYISSICEDGQKNIYIGTLKNGLYRLNKKRDKIEKVHSDSPNEHFLQVKSLLFDSRKRLWVGTEGKGLKILSEQTGRLKEYVPNKSPFDFSKSKIHSIAEDNAGNIWLGIFQKGLFLLPEANQMFKHYGYKPFGDQNIGSSCIKALVSDGTSVWAGTDGDGIYELSRTGKKLDHILFENKENGYSGNNILAICDDGRGNLWLGTYLNGLIRLKKQSREFKVFRNIPNDKNSLPNDKISCISRGLNNSIWLGTMGSGVARYDLKAKRFIQEYTVTGNDNSLLNNFINDIYVESNERIWIATFSGLTLAEPAKNKTTHFIAANNYLPNDIVYCIKPDSKGNLWIGTDQGLVKLNAKREPEKVYQIENGLPGNVICSIEEDEYNQLWISTHNGLAKLNPRNDLILRYYDYDGLQANEFSARASSKGISNEIYFGGINGITEIVNKNEEPLKGMRDVVLTDLILFGRSIEIGSKSGEHTILNQSILISDTVQLESKDNAFTIAFTTMELANRSRVDYEYQLVGFDKNWKTTDALKNRATYTNLDPGKYLFKVRGVDGSKVSATREILVVIRSPWFQTPIAIVGWFLLGLFLLYWPYVFFKERVKQHQAERLNEMKMQFFINISHEVKTPLTLILDPLEKLLLQSNEESRTRVYQVMHKNASRIFQLINQLLDIRKIDKKQLLFKFQKINLFDFVQDVSESFRPLVTNKSIQFKIDCEDKNVDVWIDPLNFEKVILNLLSNAFKFTQTNGHVDIKITREETRVGKKKKKHVKISVLDTGIGIKESEVENIFKRFYQINSKETNFNTGTGIGLHLAMSMVKMHGGKIYAENRTECQGSNFSILLPLGNEHLPVNDLITEENLIPAPTKNIVKDYDIQTDGIIASKASNKKGLKLMIVDDDEDIRQYLASQFAEDYDLALFSNGSEAYKALTGHKPDLIISDILMPEMDGITFCKKVKGNNKINHIPVILLTALSKEEDKAEGIDTGADMYLTKPFNTRMLKKIAENLIENRKKLLERQAELQSIQNIADIELNSHDEMLLQKVMTIVKENISDSTLNVETLSDGIGISRVHMHRKLKELTNQSARDFIKGIRMKQAAYLLANKKVNVSEIAYAVGFSNPSHFSTTFKSYYGISPKEYAENRLE